MDSAHVTLSCHSVMSLCDMREEGVGEWEGKKEGKRRGKEGEMEREGENEAELG